MQALPSPGMHPFDTNSYKESPPPESAAAHFAQRQKWAPRFGAQFMALSKCVEWGEECWGNVLSLASLPSPWRQQGGCG